MSRTTLKRLVVVVAVAPIVVFAAWRLYDSTVAHPPADMAKLAPAYATAPKEIWDQAAKAASAGKAKDYATAVRALGVIVDKAGFSEEQKQALIFTLTEIRRKVSEASPPDRDLLDRVDELTLKLTD